SIAPTIFPIRPSPSRRYFRSPRKRRVPGHDEQSRKLLRRREITLHPFFYTTSLESLPSSGGEDGPLFLLCDARGTDAIFYHAICIAQENPPMRQIVRSYAFLFLLILISACCMAQDKVALTYKATKGQVTRYKSEGTMNMEAGGMKVTLELK